MSISIFYNLYFKSFAFPIHFSRMPFRLTAISVYCSQCLNSALLADSGDSQPDTSAEAVGLEAGTVYTFLEGYPHSTCVLHGL